MDNSNTLIQPAVGREKSAVETLIQHDVVVQPMPKPIAYYKKPNITDQVPNKKRKTRRGKSKRKYPYNGRNSNKTVIKPEAPHNSNQFLLEDHGIIEELDENLKNAHQLSSTTTVQTRDSSFSVDSEGEFYSSPDDEEQFLIKDFVDQYESLQAERLQAMTKTELVQEYLMLETKMELLTKRLSNNKRDKDSKEELGRENLQKEVERLRMENEALKRENDLLKKNTNCSLDSEDSETDSSDSCSSTSSSTCSTEKAPSSPLIDYSKRNGHEVEIV